MLSLPRKSRILLASYQLKIDPQRLRLFSRHMVLGLNSSLSDLQININHHFSRSFVETARDNLILLDSAHSIVPPLVSACFPEPLLPGVASMTALRGETAEEGYKISSFGRHSNHQNSNFATLASITTRSSRGTSFNRHPPSTSYPTTTNFPPPSATQIPILILDLHLDFHFQSAKLPTMASPRAHLSPNPSHGGFAGRGGYNASPKYSPKTSPQASPRHSPAPEHGGFGGRGGYNASPSASKSPSPQPEYHAPPMSRNAHSAAAHAAAASSSSSAHSSLKLGPRLPSPRHSPGPEHGGFGGRGGYNAPIGGAAALLLGPAHGGFGGRGGYNASMGGVKPSSSGPQPGGAGGKGGYNLPLRPLGTNAYNHSHTG